MDVKKKNFPIQYIVSEINLCPVFFVRFYGGFCEREFVSLNRSRLFTRRWSIPICPFHSWTQMRPVNLLQVGRYKFQVETESRHQSQVDCCRRHQYSIPQRLISMKSAEDWSRIQYMSTCRKTNSFQETPFHFVIAFINK